MDTVVDDFSALVRLRKQPSTERKIGPNATQVTFAPGSFEASQEIHRIAAVMGEQAQQMPLAEVPTALR